VRLEPGSYATECAIPDCQTIPGHETAVERSTALGFSVQPQAAGPTVSYLKRDSTT
jgi:hypothetical protein